MNIATFEEFNMGANPSEGSEISIDPTVIENLVELVGSEEEVESAAKEAFEELKKAFDENDIELKEGDAPESLAMSALVLKLVELGKLGPQEADKFIEENLGEPEEEEEESEAETEDESEDDEAEA
jgi:hypothetical protein